VSATAPARVDDALSGSASAAEVAKPDHSAFPALDGIRALAVAAVIGTHAAFWTYRYGRGPGAGMLTRLDSGVALFFVLSGFLLSRPWLVAAATGKPGPLLRVYLWRRALRILPVYWVAVTFAFFVLHDNRNVTAADWLRQASFTQIYHLGWMRAGLTQTWSLCTEVAFYLVLPVFGVLALAWSRRFGWNPALLLIVCTVLVAATTAWYVWIHNEGWSAFTSANLWLPGYLSWFAGGIGMAIIEVHLTHHPARSQGRWRLAHDLGASPGSCWVIALGLFVVAATPIAGPRTVGLITTGEAITRNLLYLGLAVMIVWPAVFGPRTWANAIFANRPMRKVGELSYSIFLLHLVVLEGAMNVLGYRLFTGSATAVFGLTLAGSIVLSAISFRLVERPAMSLRRLVSARPRRAQSIAPAATPTQ
jgi:peptidoglycan/LPS O-acetylase OafA/YrhL